MHYLAATLLVLGYCVLCVLCWWSYQRKHKHEGQIKPIQGDKDVLIGYASQTGHANELAQKTAMQLRDTGISATVLPLNQITPEFLSRFSKILFVISTYGEGEAPDNGNRFLSRCTASLCAGDLAQLQFGILALGDSNYTQFCGFAHAVQRVLHGAGARSLFDIVEVDKQDESALRHWQYYLGKISGNANFTDWTKPGYSAWTLIERCCLNPDSPGAPVFHLRFEPSNKEELSTAWKAGDIAEIGPCNSTDRIEEFLAKLNRSSVTPAMREMLASRDLPQTEYAVEPLKSLSDSALCRVLPELPHREYSIASIPAEKTLDLLVRQTRDSKQQLGLGSGWLGVYSPVPGPIRLRLRSNPHFHAPGQNVPMILIGNGTGIAGLRAHIAERAACGRTPNWLFFGERTAAHDQFFAIDIQRWQSQGILTHVNVVFSRDAVATQGNVTLRYVQDLLPQHAQEINAWVKAGAVIYVCGSLHGMAQGVDMALRQILGETMLDTLADTHRYCRDVY